jgi:hypothetical protein
VTGEKTKRRMPNWHTIADKLAGRLMYAAYGCDHRPPQEDCPFCADTAAYEAYLEAGGTVRLPSPSGRSVRIAELREET